MGKITLEQIGMIITFIVGMISGIAYIHKITKQWINKSLKEELDPVLDKLDDLQGNIRDVDMGAVKNYLVSFLADVEKGNLINEIEKERFWEQYEHYQKIGGNSYVTRKVEQLKNDGKL